MKIDDPSSWTQDEFEAFVMLIASAADLEMEAEEKNRSVIKLGRHGMI